MAGTLLATAIKSRSISEDIPDMTETPPDLLKVLSAFEGFRDLGMWDAAWAALERLPQEHQGHPDVLLGRLDVLVGRNDWERALEFAGQVGTVLKDNPDAWLDIACAHSQQGNIQAAMVAVKECVALDQRFSTVVLQEPLLGPMWSATRI